MDRPRVTAAAARELAWVLALAAAGLLLAALVAFAPWYPATSGAEPGPPSGSDASPPAQTTNARVSRIAAPPA